MSDRLICARTRPNEGAPSLSIGVEASSANVALVRFLDRYPDQIEGTRVDVRRPGASRHDVIATYVRNAHAWAHVGRCMCPDDCNCHRPYRTNYCGCKLH